MINDQRDDETIGSGRRQDFRRECIEFLYDLNDMGLVHKIKQGWRLQVGRQIEDYCIVRPNGEISDINYHHLLDRQREWNRIADTSVTIDQAIDRFLIGEIDWRYRRRKEAEKKSGEEIDELKRKIKEIEDTVASIPEFDKVMNNAVQALKVATDYQQ